MTKSELQDSIKSKSDEFEAIISTAKEAKRELSSDENEKIELLKSERADLSSKIEALDAEDAERELKAKDEAKEALRAELKLEVAEEIKRELNDKQKLDEELEIENKRNLEIMNEDKVLGLVEAVQESYRGTGGTVKASERAAIDGDTGVMGAAIPNYVEGLDILGYEPIWKQMGVDVMSGANGTFTLPYEDPIVGAKVAELASVTGDTVTPTGILISPNRFSVSKTFTIETMNSATPEFLQKVLGDMVKGCDRAITKEVYVKALAGATEIAGGAITKAGFDLLMSGAEVELDGAFLANRATFFEAKGIAIDAGSGRFLVERAGNVSVGSGTVYDGSPFWYSNLFEDGANQKYVVYGDTSKLFVADYGMVEVIVDKYTQAADGKVIITVNKLADVAIKNPAAFSKTADLDPA